MGERCLRITARAVWLGAKRVRECCFVRLVGDWIHETVSSPCANPAPGAQPRWAQGITNYPKIPHLPRHAQSRRAPCRGASVGGRASASCAGAHRGRGACDWRSPQGGMAGACRTAQVSHSPSPFTLGHQTPPLLQDQPPLPPKLLTCSAPYARRRCAGSCGGARPGPGPRRARAGGTPARSAAGWRWSACPWASRSRWRRCTAAGGP